MAREWRFLLSTGRFLVSEWFAPRSGTVRRELGWL
jgi:hypothetical protein